MRHSLLTLGRRHWFDAVIVLAAVGIVVEVVLNRNHEDAPTRPLWLLVPAELLLILPLFARRRFPFGVPVAIIVFAAALSFWDGQIVPFTFTAFLVVLTVCFLIASLREWRQAVAGLAIALAAATIVNWNQPDAGEDYAFIPIVFTLTWVAGFALSRRLLQAEAAEERASKLERERELRALEAVAEERARIARELHDVVAHGVSVMTVQAGAVRRLLRPDQEREREALEVIEQTGREALAEMRRMVGVMKRPEEGPALAPQPSLEHLDKLVEQVREAGLDVRLRVEGAPVPLTAGIDLSAYRIVQEGLTNTLKHARASRAEVLVRYAPDGVELVVWDDGQGNANGAGGGHGLVGMRERVAVYGGDIEAGPKDGGYELRARLPVSQA